MTSRSPAQPPLRKRTRLAAAALCLLLLAAAAALLVRTCERRRDGWEAVRELGAVAEQPAVLATLRLVQNDDDASALAAESLLGGAAPAGADRRLERARKLVLESIADRPGSAHYRELLARAAPPRRGGRKALWEKPLELAAAAAPALDSPREELAARYLAVWPNLTAEERAKAIRMVEQAFRRASFVSDKYLDAVFALGPDAAARLLPADRDVLMAALDVAAARGNARAAEVVSLRLKDLSGVTSAR